MATATKTKTSKAKAAKGKASKFWPGITSANRRIASPKAGDNVYYVKPAELVVHPLAELFPAMSDDEYTKFLDSVIQHGISDPVWVDEAGRVPDGRHRLRAAQESQLNLIPVRRLADRGIEGEEAIRDFVVAQNMNRRHLTESQRAMVAAALADGKHGGNRQEKNSTLASGKTIAQASEAMNVSTFSTKAGKKVLESKHKPTIEAVKAGKLAVSLAVEALELLEKRAISEVLKSYDTTAPAELRRRVQREKERKARAAAVGAVREKLESDGWLFCDAQYFSKKYDDRLATCDIWYKDGAWEVGPFADWEWACEEDWRPDERFETIDDATKAADEHAAFQLKDLCPKISLQDDIKINNTFLMADWDRVCPAGFLFQKSRGEATATVKAYPNGQWVVSCTVEGYQGEIADVIAGDYATAMEHAENVSLKLTTDELRRIDEENGILDQAEGSVASESASPPISEYLIAGGFIYDKNSDDYKREYRDIKAKVQIDYSFVTAGADQGWQWIISYTMQKPFRGGTIGVGFLDFDVEAFAHVAHWASMQKGSKLADRLADLKHCAAPELYAFVEANPDKIPIDVALGAAAWLEEAEQCEALEGPNTPSATLKNLIFAAQEADRARVRAALDAEAAAHDRSIEDNAPWEPAQPPSAPVAESPVCPFAQLRAAVDVILALPEKDIFASEDYWPTDQDRLYLRERLNDANWKLGGHRAGFP